ncbi:MAG: caspase family protein [Planctomycetaceae bacterium]|jgi:molybdenum cofactor biosynthesis enzyme MoaA|nr:caspase family protein [Planctomycetaceae bacterium]
MAPDTRLFSDVTTTGYSLEKFYTELSKLNLKTVTVFLDACFSGAKREDEMLASAHGVAVKVKDEAPKGNMVVFSAANSDETAHQYEEKGHGLFTYFLLKKLQETQGAAIYGHLS